MELTGVCTVPVPAAIHAAGASRLVSAIEGALGNSDIRVIVLEGTEAEFCRGMDIASVSGSTAGDLESNVRTFARVLTLLMESPKPTVAVLRGPALGGGLGLAAACDMVVASRGATCGLPEGLLGLTPAVITPALLGRMTAQRFKRLALLAEPVAADEARSLGLVDEVVESDAVSARVRRICIALMRIHPRTALAIGEAVQRSRAGTRSEAISWGVTETTAAATSPDVIDRIGRFLEGEAPWQTR